MAIKQNKRPRVKAKGNGKEATAYTLPESPLEFYISEETAKDIFTSDLFF